MSLITRCPACETMFKVVADQLKVSEGWVRCGHCDGIFDATANLQEESLPAPAPAGLQRPSPGAQPEPQQPRLSTVPRLRDEPVIPLSSPSVTEPATLRAKPQSDDYPSTIHSEVDDSAIAGFPDSRELDEQARALQADPLDRPFELRRADAPDHKDSGPRGQSRPAPLADPDLDDLSFVRQARRKAFWRRSGVRATLVLLGVMLAVLLAVQVAWNDRDRLAATEPGLRPWLVKACEAARCTIGAPRRIEAIAIDSSSFNKLRTDAYRLNVSLKNHADTDVAMPALELTLTDSQEQPVLRRVLLPAEFAGRTTALRPGTDWSTSLALGVTGSSASRIAGYRVLAFYP